MKNKSTKNRKIILITGLAFFALTIFSSFGLFVIQPSLYFPPSCKFEVAEKMESVPKLLISNSSVGSNTNFAVDKEKGIVYSLNQGNLQVITNLVGFFESNYGLDYSINITDIENQGESIYIMYTISASSVLETSILTQTTTSFSRIGEFDDQKLDQIYPKRSGVGILTINEATPKLFVEYPFRQFLSDKSYVSMPDSLYFDGENLYISQNSTASGNFLRLYSVDSDRPLNLVYSKEFDRQNGLQERALNSLVRDNKLIYYTQHDKEIVVVDLDTMQLTTKPLLSQLDAGNLLGSIQSDQFVHRYISLSKPTSTLLSLESGRIGIIVQGYTSASSSNSYPDSFLMVYSPEFNLEKYIPIRPKTWNRGETLRNPNNFSIQGSNLYYFNQSDSKVEKYSCELEDFT
jgi:hypothetical protein